MERAARQQVYRIGNLELVLHDLSITELEPLDALVSADDNYLTHGGGVSRTLWRAAGPGLLTWVAAHRSPLRLGEVLLSPAFDLRARHLLHAITIDFDENRRLGPRETAALFGRVLDRAAAEGCTSVGLPLLGGGAGRVGVTAAAVALADALLERAPITSALERVALCALGGDFDRCSTVFDARLRQRPPLAELVERVAAATQAPSAAHLLAAWQALCDAGPEEPALPAVVFFEGAVRLLFEEASPGVRADDHEPPARLLDRARLAYDQAGTELPSRLHACCRRAIEARNHLAHAAVAGEEQGRQLRALLVAAEEVLLFLDGRRALPVESLSLSSASSEDPRQHQLRAAMVRRRRSEGGTATPRGTAGADPGRSPQDPALGGTGHVHALRDLLLEMMDEESLAEHLQQLESMGYRGSGEMRLLEFCVNEPDPASWMASHFSNRELRRTLRKRAGIELGPDAGAPENARALLDYLGFPVQRTFHGLESATRELKRCELLVQSAQSREQISGAVAETAKHLEFVTMVLIRFVCQAAFHVPAENYLRAAEKLQAGYELERCTLGRLLELLEFLWGRLQDQRDRHVALFQRAFDTRALAPDVAQRIAALRNEHLHYREAGTRSVEGDRRSALEFFLAARAYLERLGSPEHRIFPHVVMIEEIRIDRWGRRVILARDDLGVEERIFTERALRPGELYYMHPLSNPLRVDPILVPAGEQEQPLRKR